MQVAVTIGEIADFDFVNDGVVVGVSDARLIETDLLNLVVDAAPRTL